MQEYDDAQDADEDAEDATEESRGLSFLVKPNTNVLTIQEIEEDMHTFNIEYETREKTSEWALVSDYHSYIRKYTIYRGFLSLCFKNIDSGNDLQTEMLKEFFTHYQNLYLSSKHYSTSYTNFLVDMTILLTNLNVPFHTSHSDEHSNLVFDIFIPEKKLAINFLNQNEAVTNNDKNTSEASTLLRVCSEVHSVAHPENKKSSNSQTDDLGYSAPSSNVPEQVQKSLRQANVQDAWDFSELHATHQSSVHTRVEFIDYEKWKEKYRDSTSKESFIKNLLKSHQG